MRHTTFQILNNVITKKSYLNLSLQNIEHEQINNITIRCYGVIQNYHYLDFLVDHYTERKKLDEKTKIILMMSIYEKIYLDSIKDYVIISEYQKLCKKINRNALKYVSYFLNNNINKVTHVEPKFKDEIKNISIKYSHPKWLVKKLSKQYPNNYLEILKANNQKNIVTARVVNQLNNSYEHIFEDLIKIDGSIIKNEDFKNKNIVIQGIGSYLASKLVGFDLNEDCLDLCAAPGNKTMHLSTMFKRVYANEISENRFNLLTKTLNKYDIINVCTMNLDAQDFEQLSSTLKAKKFKYILADVPCSGTGTLSSKPELKLTLDSYEVDNLKNIQYNIIKNALNFLEKDGYIVYSTCSINKEENEEQIKRFVRDFNLEDVTDSEYTKYDSNSEYGVTLLPNVFNSDGFYMCKLKRK